MANNRMWLIHRPSKLGVMLGKCMAWGWYEPPEATMLRRFYDHIADTSREEDGNDFVLAMESGCFEDWDYNRDVGENGLVDGFMSFKIKEKGDNE